MSRAARCAVLSVAAATVGLAIAADPLPADTTYRPLPTLPFSAVKANDEAQKAQVMQRQQTMLQERYDLADKPIAGVMMSGGKKAVQGTVRVKLPAGAGWDMLANLSPDEIRQRELLPERLQAAAACQACDRRSGVPGASDR